MFLFCIWYILGREKNGDCFFYLNLLFIQFFYPFFDLTTRYVRKTSNTKIVTLFNYNYCGIHISNDFNKRSHFLRYGSKKSTHTDKMNQLSNKNGIFLKNPNHKSELFDLICGFSFLRKKIVFIRKLNFFNFSLCACQNAPYVK